MEIRGLNLWVREDKFLTRAATTTNTTGWSMMASVSGAKLLLLASTLKRCSKWYGRICLKYRHHGKEGKITTAAKSGIT
jgi:hypothetical protein